MAGAAVAAVVVIGAGISMYGQIAAGNAAKKAADRNAELQRQAGKVRIEVNKAEAKFRARKFIVERGYKEALDVFGGSTGGYDFLRRDVATLAEQELLYSFNAEYYNVQQQNRANVTTFEGEALKRSATIGAIGTGVSALGTAAGAGTAVNQAFAGGGATNLGTQTSRANFNLSS